MDLFGTKLVSLKEVRDIRGHSATGKRTAVSELEKGERSTRKEEKGARTPCWYVKGCEVLFHDSADPVEAAESEEETGEGER